MKEICYINQYQVKKNYSGVIALQLTLPCARKKRGDADDTPLYMESSYIIIPLVAFTASVLTFFSGFGLGTLLTPVCMAFFPAPIAVAMAGVVHFFNNILKLTLTVRYADLKTLIRFGIPAVLAAIPGALLLGVVSAWPPLLRYHLGAMHAEIQPVKLILAVLLIFFALIDLLPALKRIQFGREKLVLGGILSGFFGGLSGNQGALRSAFLIKAGLSKEAFIGTAVVVSTFVDLTRLGVYATHMAKADFSGPNSAGSTLLIAATVAAMAGALVGNTLLKKVTLHMVQTTVAVMLIALSLALGAGLV